MNRMEEAQAVMIWDKYKTYKKGREVVRSGFGLCGAYGSAYAEGVRRPPGAMESILEHQAATTFLAIAIVKIFPQLLPKSLHQRLIELMAVHDVVEVESGDQADDGHLDKTAKAAYEKSAMIKFTAGMGDSLLHYFMLLEQVDGLPMRNADAGALFGQLAFIIDKMEAILQLAFFELNGVTVDLQYKTKHFGGITERDQFYVDLTGKTAALDVWMAHFYDFAKSYKDFWLGRAITEAAYYDARGYYPEWLDKVLAESMSRCWPANKS